MGKKKVGIITFHASHNYGSMLQAYALQQTVLGMGCECEIINFRTERQQEFYRPIFSKGSFVDRLKRSLFYAPYLSSWKKKHQLFEKFIKERYHLSQKEYTTLEELEQADLDYDIYVSGSDQIWNPTQLYCLEPYFLTFAPKGKKKVSYASSIAVTELNADEKQDFQRWLSDYDIISVRERHAQQLLASFISQPVTLVADPTFLLDAGIWKAFAVNPKRQSPYILLFTLDYDIDLLRFAVRISREAGLCLIYLNQLLPKLDNEDCVAVRDAGPKEFLGYIACADMVITNSYHATVFSIILEAKSFYAYIAGHNQRGSRITDLLDTFGLQQHLLRQDLSEDYRTLSSRRTDWHRIREQAQRERNGGREFLNKALS